MSLAWRCERMHGLVSGSGVQARPPHPHEAEESMGHLTFPTTRALGPFEPHHRPKTSVQATMKGNSPQPDAHRSTRPLCLCLCLCPALPRPNLVLRATPHFRRCDYTARTGLYLLIRATLEQPGVISITPSVPGRKGRKTTAFASERAA